MKKLLISLFTISLLALFSTAKANDSGILSSKPGLSLAPSATNSPTLFGKRKRGKRWLAGGIVIGQPTGFGGRILVTPWRLGIAADVSFDQIRLDNGQAAGATTIKLDGRFYGKGILRNFLRPYVFGGVTTTLANFNDFDKSLMRIDAGVGAEMRIWRLGLNGELGLLLPTEQVANYQQGIGLFGNVGILLFIM